MGAAFGAGVAVQMCAAFPTGSGRALTLFQLWALGWAGLFGLPFASVPSSASAMWIAAGLLILYYAAISAVLRRSLNVLRPAGALFAGIAAVAVHVTMYYWIVSSVH